MGVQGLGIQGGGRVIPAPAAGSFGESFSLLIVTGMEYEIWKFFWIATGCRAYAKGVDKVDV